MSRKLHNARGSSESHRPAVPRSKSVIILTLLKTTWMGRGGVCLVSGWSPPKVHAKIPLGAELGAKDQLASSVCLAFDKASHPGAS